MADPSPFEGCGQSAGLTAWRVEQLKLAKVDPSGKMHAGDAYVYLHSVEGSTGGALQHTIHFWIGSECSQDESAAAAIFSTDLDQFLGGAPAICRHVQGSEGPDFLQLFPKGVEYAPGGTASGLTSVADETSKGPLLYRVAGKRATRISQVPCEASSLNSGDCFVLDTNADLVLQWTGASAAPTLAYKALDFANQLRDDTHAGSGRVAALRQSDSDGADLAAFYKALGVTDAKSVTVADAKSDPAAVSTPPKLYEVKFSGSGASAKHTVTKSDEALTVAALQPDRTLVLVASGSTWVWTGRAVPSDLKQKPFGLAAEALAATKPKSKKKSGGGESPAASCPVIVTQQGLEGPLFKAQFSDWSAKEAEALGARKVAEAAGESAPSQEDAEVDVAALVAGASTEEEATVDDGSGKKTVWRIESFELAPVPEAEVGAFHSGDCYVVLYEYEAPSGTASIVYMWQGGAASTDERGACALQAVKVDEDKCGGGATQIRVTQGKEPRHFLLMWGGAMTVHLGGVASGFQSLAEADSQDGDTATRLYHIRGTSGADTCAVEVKPEAASLNSGDAFLLVTAAEGFLWCGKGSTEAERAAGAAIQPTVLAGASDRTVETVSEGSESEAFWTALGGKAEYASVPLVAAQHPARLFQMNDAVTGGHGVAAEEVHHYTQADLDASDVMLLDTFRSLFLWVGSESSVNERSSAVKMADEYLAASGRDPDTPVTTVTAGAEPSDFKYHFHAWDDAKRAPTAADFEARIAQLRAENPAPAADDTPAWAADAAQKSEANADLADSTAEAKAEALTKEADAPEAPVDAPAETDSAAGNASAAGGESAADGEPAAGGEPAAAAEVDSEPTASVKDTIEAAKARAPTGEPAVPAGRATTAAPPKATGLTPMTVRGTEFETHEGDPSGSKPVDLKYQPGSTNFTAEELKGMSGVDGIDPAVKEAYLSDADFEEVFGIERARYESLAAWRKIDHKKRVGLF